MNINICKNCNSGELRIIYGNKKTQVILLVVV